MDLLQNDIQLIKDIRGTESLDEINTIWYSIMRMDIIDLYLSLNDTIQFGELSKNQFLALMQEKFRKHKILGDTEFYLHLIECFKIHSGEIICEFVGIESGINLGLVFDFEGSHITGVQFCNCFGGIEDLNGYYDW